MSKRSSRLRDELLEEYAEIMLLALRKEAGVFFETDAFYKAKERVMEALTGLITL